jgi:hypothetical protein
MTTRDQREEDLQKATDEKEEGKKTYKKPSFRCEQVFVTSALSCGKVQATQAACRLNRKLS